MKILFITAHRYLPHMYGGLQTTTDQLCLGLLERGHKVAVLAGIMRGGYSALKSRIKMHMNDQIFRHNVSREMCLGYPVWYSSRPSNEVEYVTTKEKPDVIVVLSFESVRMALAAVATKIPIMLMLQDVEFKQHGGNFAKLGNVRCIANSNFTADTYRRAYSVNPSVIYPFILPERYKTKTTKNNVTFINPVPVKGRDIAVEIARFCPDIPFAFIESWPLWAEWRRELTRKLSGLPNVTVFAPQKDMRKVYGKCKVLIIPSTWEEAYGMVATEAQINGIPVVASARGGLPEAVGPGGVLLDPDGRIEDWVSAVRKLWQDEKYYEDLSAAALGHAQRIEMNSSYQIDAYEQALLAACLRDGP